MRALAALQKGVRYRLKLFTAVAHSLESYGRMIENIKKGLSPFLCVGLSAIHKANFIYAARQDLNTPLLLLTQDDLAAARLAADINAMAGTEDFALVFPSRDYSRSLPPQADGAALPRLLSHPWRRAPGQCQARDSRR